MVGRVLQLAFFVNVLHVIAGFQWTGTSNGTSIQSCMGESASMAFSYTLEQNEEIDRIEWRQVRDAPVLQDGRLVAHVLPKPVFDPVTDTQGPDFRQDASSLQRGAFVDVDEVQVRLTLAESLQGATREIRSELDRQNKVDTSFGDEMEDLRARDTAVKAELEQQKTAVTAQIGDLRAVAFHVQFKSDDNQNGIRLGHRSTLKFDNVITNLGNGYNPLTGIFTAPVAGLYSFSLSAMTTAGRNHASLAIVKQGTDLAKTWGGGRHDPEDQSTKTVPVYLDEGDQVWVAQRYGDAVRGAWWTTFSGMLEEAD
nr:hypothetical protein BaRGS_026705 [Batillaria attramentaria]